MVEITIFLFQNFRVSQILRGVEGIEISEEISSTSDTSCINKVVLKQVCTTTRIRYSGEEIGFHQEMTTKGVARGERGGNLHETDKLL